jgi:hypothetical protein
MFLPSPSAGVGGIFLEFFVGDRLGGKVAEFDFIHVTRMSGVQLFKAGIIEPEKESEESKKKPSEQLKIQLLFYGRCIEKGGDKIISQVLIKELYSALGDKILAKFKVEEEVFQRLIQMGLKEGSICDWDVVTQIWNIQGKSGIWYRPAALIRIDGRDINYQILKNQDSAKKPMQDAFARFGKSNHTQGTWDAALGSLEQEINSELQGASQ